MEANTSKDDVNNGSTNSKDSEDESFVTKVRSRVSGLFSSSISRLFKNQEKHSGVVRPRSFEDDESHETQPPCKRAKGIENATSSTHYIENTVNRSDFMIGINNELSSEITLHNTPGPSFSSRRHIPSIVTNTSTPLETISREKNVGSECTSGYSSMVKLSERHQNAVEKQSAVTENVVKPVEKTFSEGRSLFNESTPDTPSRSLFADMSPQDKNKSLSSRRPSFNTSSFGSPSFVDRTLTTNKIINSPFYNGSTIYGGASAYGRQLGINETRRQQLKNSFMVKPINKPSDTKSFTSLSKTARRILETLEQCSTPMSDVKKVPLPTRTNRQGLFSSYVTANPYQKISKIAMNKELLVPSVSDRLKMKQIQRLQDTTNEIRHIATSSNSNLNEEYKVASENQLKHTNKMKSKITSIRTKAPTIEVLDDYILNPVPLMIPENKLATFEIPNLNINVLTETTIKSKENPISVNAEPVGLKSTTLAENEKSSIGNLEKSHDEGDHNMQSTYKEDHYVKFADKGDHSVKSTGQGDHNVKSTDKEDHDVKSTDKRDRNVVNEVTMNKQPFFGELKDNKTSLAMEYTFSKPLVIADNSTSIIAINNFKFSEPLSKKIKMSENVYEVVKQKTESKKTEKLTNGSISGEIKHVDTTKKTKDPLLEKFKAPEGTWECQTCLIRNKSELTKCAACETPRVEKIQNIKKDSLSLALQFSKKIDEWDCSTCLVRNKEQNNVCVACSTPKIPKPEANGIGGKSKIPSKEWECETCWVRNKNESLKCVACETARNDSSSKSSDRTKASPKVTKCSVCLNELKGRECTKCDINQVKYNFPSHLKPANDSWECGTCLIRNKNELKSCAACETPRQTLEIEIKIEAASKKSDKWECPTCMVRNNPEVEKCPCCETAKPGVTLINKSNVNMFNFGVNKSQFSFGIPKDMQNTSSSAVSSTSSLFANNTSQNSTAPPVFKFGITPETVEKDSGSAEQKNITPANLIVSKSESKPDSSSTSVQSTKSDKEKSDSFQFKTPAAVSDKTTLPVFNFGAPSTDLKEPSKDSTTPNLMFKFTPPKPITEEKKLPLPLMESVKKPENLTSPFATPATSQNDSSKLLFSFGNKSNDSANQSTKPSFSFGSSTSSTQPGGFNFSTGKTDVTLQPPSVPSFVSNPIQQPQSTNAGGTTLKNGGFNFGSSMSNNQAAVFSFGAPSNATEATPLTQGGFDFSSAMKPATGGFNFSSPAPSFDAGNKPSFNFTGGSIPTFSANPTEGGGGPAPARKFKRAVRRTQR